MDIKEMFQLIEDYHKTLGYNFKLASNKERMEGVRFASLALNQEVAELVDSFPWKPWRKFEDQPYDLENAVEEIVDCLFFLGLIMEAVIIFPHQIEKVFHKKLRENYNRIKHGYNNTKEDR